MEISMGLYTDVGLASLPQTIAMLGSSFARFDGGMLGHRSKRSRTTTSSSSSGGETSGADDKKMMERERNRRQARKSRTLKKQCADRMQEQLTQLRKETEELEAKSKEAAQKLAACRDDRRRTLQMVFDLRADGCVDEDAWAELVSEDLRLTLPITPYRSFSPADVVKNRRVLLGVDGMISDVQSLNVSCDSIGVKTRRNESPVSIEYTLGCDDDSDGGGGGAFFNKDGLMCTFRMRTLDAVAHGARNECEKSGMVRARFDIDNKIEELDITFDPVAYYQQLMRAAGKTDFPVVPNTLQNALQDKKSRIVVTTPRLPFRITHVNSAWTDLCGFELEECEGKSLSILQGAETDMARVAELCKMSDKGYAASMVVTNHNKKGECFRNHLRCYPVSSDDAGQISHIVGMLSPIPSQNDDPRAMPMLTVKAF